MSYQAHLHVFSDSVLCLGRRAMWRASETFSQRWEDHRLCFKDFATRIERKRKSMSTRPQVPPQENWCSTSSFGCKFHSSNLRSSNHHDEDDDRNGNFRPKIEQQRSSVYVIRKKPWISSRSSDATTSCTLAQVK